MKAPVGLETLERASLHWSAARRAAHAELRMNPQITAPALAAHLHRTITTTRDCESVAMLIGACIANLPSWRKRLRRYRIVGATESMKRSVVALLLIMLCSCAASPQRPDYTYTKPPTGPWLETWCLMNPLVNEALCISELGPDTVKRAVWTCARLAPSVAEEVSP